jgi:hypothetical protein
MNLPLNKQTTPAIVELYRRLHKKFDSNGNASPLAINLLTILKERGYDFKKLIDETPI